MIGAKPQGRRAAALACLGLVGVVASTVTSAGAQTVTGAGTPTTTDDRAAAEALVGPVEKGGPTAVTAPALAHARDALEQATRLRAAGDEAHAKAADGLAREWAETARDLALAVAAEKQAEDRKRQAMQAQALLERTRALVEDGIAHLGRLRAELGAAPGKPVTAVERHDGDPKPGTAKPQAANGSTP